jgi:uncharacterized membrane protein
MSDFKQWDPEDAVKAKQAVDARVQREAGRIEAFSDGVFAIAITLLVLEIKVPPAWSKVPLTEALLKEYPDLVGYVISFLTILVMWLNHHRLFKLIRRTDEWLTLVNGLLLMVVAFVPFSTSVMAQHWNDSERQTGVLFFTGVFILLSLVFQALWGTIAYKNRLVDRMTDHRQIEGITRQYIVGPVMYIAAFIVGLWSPEACLAMTMIYAIYFAIPGLSFAIASEEEEDGAQA